MNRDVDLHGPAGRDLQAPPAPPIELPNIDCGLCGVRTCREFADRLPAHPELIARCIHLSADRLEPAGPGAAPDGVSAPPSPAAGRPARAPSPGAAPASPGPCGACALATEAPAGGSVPWRDTLGREFDFYLEHFPEEPGPREIIIPHNPLLTRELDIRPGDTLIGRPLGLSCGCPITHCGVAMDVDARTGVLAWCVTGPLQPRQGGFKDLGYYIAEAYEGLITEARGPVEIGRRYYFQPRMCMLQWRHSGLVNYLSRTAGGLQVRVEGLWIG